MSKFFETWKSFKDDVSAEKPGKILKEFTRQDKEELVSQGDNFTISYEIEMISKDAIDDQGNIGNVAKVRSIKSLTQEEQVAEFGLQRQLEQAAEDEDSKYFLQDYYNTSSRYADILSPTSLAIISIAKKLVEKDATDFTLSTDDIDLFLITLFLYNNPEIKASLMSADDNKESYLEKIGYYNFEEDAEENDPSAIRLRAKTLRSARQYDSISNFIADFFGFATATFEVQTFADRFRFGIDKMAFFEHLIGQKIEDSQVKVMEDFVQSLIQTGGDSPTLGELKNLRSGPPPSQMEKFKDFNLFLLATIRIAGYSFGAVRDRYEDAINHFDYLDYQINLEDYDLYDPDYGPPPINTAGGSNALDKYLPNFWGKHGKDMDSVLDASLPKNHGIEIKMKTFLTGLNNAVRYLDEFFNDFENQDNFSFSDETGLHTNLSMDVPNKKFNLLKALIFLSEEETTPGKTPYAYKGTESRFQNQDWSKPLKNKAIEYIKQSVKKMPQDSRARLTDAYKNNDFDFLSDYFSNMIKDFAGNLYVKGYGFNVNYIDNRGYIEFRYPGHTLTKEGLTNLTLYYAYIVKLSLDPTFKREEYIAKLVKLLQHIFSTDQKEIGSTKEFIEAYKIITPIMNNLFKTLAPNSQFNNTNLSNFYNSLLENYISIPSSRYSWKDYFKLANKPQMPINLLQADPSLRDEIIDKFKKYKRIPAYYYLMRALETKKNDPSDFFFSLSIFHDVLNNLFYDNEIYKRGKEFEKKVFGSSKSSIVDIMSEIEKLFVSAFNVYYERHPDEFPAVDVNGNVIPPGQQQIQENVFDRYEKAFEKLYEKKKKEVLNKTDPGHTFKGQSHFYSNDQEEEEMEEGRKLGKPSSETSLRDWFKRKGAPGKRGGWVDCNTCRDGKCSPCGRQGGEERSKYPRCRPTPSQCKGYKRRGDNLQK